MCLNKNSLPLRSDRLWKMDDGSLIRLATGSTPNIDLRVHDNDEGFDPDGAAGGMGLSTMRERVEDIRVVWPKGHEG